MWTSLLSIYSENTNILPNQRHQCHVRVDIYRDIYLIYICSHCLLNYLSHPGLGWLCVFSSFPPRPSAASAAAKTFPSHVKTVSAKPLIFGTNNIWVWGNVLDDLSMTLAQGDGCGVDKQKFPCLRDKVRTTHRITTNRTKWVDMILGRLYDLAPDPTHYLDLGVSRSESEITLSQEWGGRLTMNEKDTSHPFMTIILTCVTMVGWADVPDSDRGDFRRRRAVDISSYIFTFWYFVDNTWHVKVVEGMVYFKLLMCNWINSSWTGTIFVDLHRGFMRNRYECLKRITVTLDGYQTGPEDGNAFIRYCKISQLLAERYIHKNARFFIFN